MSLPRRSNVFALCVLAALLFAPPLRAETAPDPVPPSLPAAAAAAEPDGLVGTWRVDLRPTPGAAPFYQTFVVTSVKGGRLGGRFYDTEIRDGWINKDWGAVHFAFTTSDNSGAYHTAGRLVKGRIEGTTHAVGRGFLAVWTAERVPGERQTRPPEGLKPRDTKGGGAGIRVNQPASR
jgi:hypothetical protein